MLSWPHVLLACQRGRIVARSYNKLWHKLIEMNMSKVELRKKAGLTTNALAQLGENESVPTTFLKRYVQTLVVGLKML